MTKLFEMTKNKAVNPWWSELCPNFRTTEDLLVVRRVVESRGRLQDQTCLQRSVFSNGRVHALAGHPPFLLEPMGKTSKVK